MPAGKILNQIRNFCFDISIGDIVIIPSENSKVITFGEVMSDVFCFDFTDDNQDEEICDFIKRRQVNWIKSVSKNNLESSLLRMLHAHQTISCADNYDTVIDRTLDHIYIKNEHIHLIINVRTKNEIGKNLYKLQKLIYDTNIKINSDDIDMKINVQSPGFIEFITMHKWDIITIASFLCLFVGGGKVGVVEMPGLLSWIYKFREQKNSHSLECEKFELDREKEIFQILKKEFGEDIDSLDIELPNQILKLIQQYKLEIKYGTTIKDEDK